MKATFTTILKESRKAAKLTQEQLGEATGLGRVYITQLEGGARKNPSLDVLERLRKALGERFSRAIKRYLDATSEHLSESKSK